MYIYDFVIIGGGIIGLSTALEIKRKFNSKVLIIEKEKYIAKHASGRNSGVIHAGFYYEQFSNKAKLTPRGNILLHSYCKDKNIEVNNCGKVVVCNNRQDINGLEVLYRRAIQNKVPIEKINASELLDIDKNIKTHEYALWSPSTSSVDPYKIMASLLDDVKGSDIDIMFDTQFIKRNNATLISTTKGKINAKYFINTAGLYADKVARSFGFARNYKMIPIKGLYLYPDIMTKKPLVHVYPVPNLERPFLGVHYTVTSNGSVKIGPTAMPAFWKENYSGMDKLNLIEFAEIVTSGTKLFVKNNDFRDLALKEIKKYSKRNILNEASKLYGAKINYKYVKWGMSGIRAQLFNVNNNNLEMDFIYEGDRSSFHVLNAVSPAFTCSLSMAEYIVGEVDNLIK
jgi:(S)-2-hydroxyglutarate dehydrogenase